MFLSPNQELGPISWGCRIHRLFLCRRVRPPHTHTHTPTSVLDIALNDLIVRFQ